MTIMVYRGIGHPWTAAPGWDQLFIGAGDRDSLAGMIAEAEQKLWRIWYISWETLKCHLFKPQDAAPGWKDLSWQGTPRGHGHQFKVGDEVYTDYGNRITRHKVLAIELRPISQTGVMLRVAPPPPGSAYVPEDRGRGPGKAPTDHSAVLDSAWFRKVL